MKGRARHGIIPKHGTPFIRWCTVLMVLSIPPLATAQEICDNGINEDGNGQERRRCRNSRPVRKSDAV
jgi:hypothetical protein